MRRIVSLFFIFVLVLSIAGCGINKKFNPADVTMDIVEESITPSGLTVIISNNAKIDIYGGIADDFLIEKLGNDEWSPLVEIGDRSNNTETYIFQGNRELNIYWSDLYGSLTPGTYRISKSFYLDTVDDASSSNDGFYLIAEFIIQ